MASTAGADRLSSALRQTFGVVLFVAWGLLTVLWVYDAGHAAINGSAGAAVRAVAALLLMFLLAGMEGLEVAVIDRWSELHPERTNRELGAWLSARQLFVALIVTAATLLAERESIAVPFLSTEITEGVSLKIFNLIWTTLTVLWFMQILPKVLAATNPDGYLGITSKALFPIVDVVRRIGIAQPGQWTARLVERRLGWHEDEMLEAAQPRRAALTQAWAAVIPEDRPAAGTGPEHGPPGG
jgi:hypothetical protein